MLLQHVRLSFQREMNSLLRGEKKKRRENKGPLLFFSGFVFLKYRILYHISCEIGQEIYFRRVRRIHFNTHREKLDA